VDIIIRKAQTYDIPSIYKMNNELNDTGCNTIDVMKESLTNNKNEIVFVAVHNDSAVGFICGQLYSSICYTNLQCEITELFVSKNYRRRGIASMLIKHLEDEFAKNNVSEITVVTGRKNINAQQLYENCGYTYRRMAYLKTI